MLPAEGNSVIGCIIHGSYPISRTFLAVSEIKGLSFSPNSALRRALCVRLHLVKLLWTLLVYASSVSPLTAQWGSWLGHDRGSAQSAAKALSAAEEQPLACHKGERRRSGTGSLVTSRAWNIHKEKIWRVEKVTPPQCVCCWCTPGPGCLKAKTFLSRRHRNKYRCSGSMQWFSGCCDIAQNDHSIG